MDNREHMRWKTFEEYMKEAMECPDENTFEEIEDIVEMQLMMEDYGDILKDARPLTFGLATLQFHYETSLWNKSIKEEIVYHVTTVKEHCKNPEFIRKHLNPFMFQVVYETVYKYGERLTEFDVDQQEQITKAIDSLRERVVKSRHRG